VTEDADVPPQILAELGTLRAAGHPFFAPVWRADEVGMALDADVDWKEVAELLTESYSVLAPRALLESLSRREPPG
jgi:hypothetical protein